MVLSAAEIDEMPDERRRRFRFGLKKPRRHVYKRHRAWTKDELIQWIRDRGIRSGHALMKVRKDGDPNIYDVEKAFGMRVGKVMREIHGSREKAMDEPSYLVKVAIQFRIQNREQYREARRKRPDIVPSPYWVIKRYGTFRSFIGRKNRNSLHALISDYIRLVRTLGHFPSEYESGRLGVPLDAAISCFGSKQAFDDFIETMEKSNEKPE